MKINTIISTFLVAVIFCLSVSAVFASDCDGTQDKLQTKDRIKLSNPTTLSYVGDCTCDNGPQYKNKGAVQPNKTLI